MAVSELSRVRGSAVPSMTETWADLAGRVLPGTPEAEAVARLQSWNLHVYMRAARGGGGQDRPFLPSDVIFIEPPLADA